MNKLRVPKVQAETSGIEGDSASHKPAHTVNCLCRGCSFHCLLGIKPATQVDYKAAQKTHAKVCNPAGTGSLFRPSSVAVI